MSVSFVENVPPTSATHPPVSLEDLLREPRGPEPIRGDLFGQERLEAHARQLASACMLGPPRCENSPLLRRFAENARALEEAHARIIARGVSRPEGRDLDAEWLADNYHIVEEVLREVRQDLPQGYDQELPKLAGGPGRGYPRVYALALALVTHSDSELDEARIARYLQAFQDCTPLTIGELWALPTMLRLVLVENLRRLADRMLWGWDERRRAEETAARLLGRPVGDATIAGAEAARPAAPLDRLTDPFVVRLLQLIRDQGQALGTFERLETELSPLGADANEIIRREHQRQAANQISVGNGVISLRLLAALDWNAFFERISPVEAALRDDPAGVHALQDFATRDRYRRMVEKLARGSGADELAVARRAVALAREALEQGQGQGEARAHVGYYLVDRGQEILKREFGYRPRRRERLLGWALDHPRATYFGSIGLLFAAVVAVLTGVGTGGLLAVPAWQAVLLVAALVLPVSELAVGLVNHWVTLLLPPRVLPKLEFKDGIPADCATFVVMPTMLVRPQSAQTLLERLEIHYLANPDPQLRFALLTDFADAAQEHRPEDEGYLSDALERVQALNARYAKEGEEKFFLFHRRRLWNPVENRWMGWERKRGKLSEFNRLLRGDRGTSYNVCSTDPARLSPTRFVITLDADTQLPRDSARRLIGTLAHPLNRPRFDPASGRVVEGHGVLQPRVSFHLLAASRSRFAGILAASGGIDPYSSATSDTYMDLFGVGSFTGKGIYELDAFEAATGRTFPDNQILSHDLIEGNYARCGLVTDTELFDDFPARYHAYARREHRWIRGDWQLLPWLGRRVPSADGPRPNRLPTLERWKLFDNLRRSLVAPGLVVLLALGWTVLPGSPWLWTVTGLVVPALPLFQLLISAVRRGSLAGLWGSVVQARAAAAQALMATTFLADQARVAVDATARTLARLYITRRNLLEWETAASTERRLGLGLDSFLASMWPAPALAVVLGAVVALVHPSALPVALPVLAAWLVSPLVAYWVSQPRPVAESPLSDGERQALRAIARRTWHFFETFVGEDDHWLPPDNYQEEPDGRVAHRTSPTNQGLLLLSTLAAHDLGYISLHELVERLEKTLETFDRMEKHWGHFYNWYDTRTLKPLPPAYISTVDSGNLLGCLVTLRQGLRELAEAPMLGPAVAAGLADTFGLLAEALRRPAPQDGSEASGPLRSLDEAVRRIGSLLAAPPVDLLCWEEWLGTLDRACSTLVAAVRGAAGGGPASLEPAPVRGGQADERPVQGSELEMWGQRLVGQVRQLCGELAALAPWVPVLRRWEGEGEVTWPSGTHRRLWQSARTALVTPMSLAALADRREALAAELDELAGCDPSAAGLGAVASAVRATAAPLLRTRLRSLDEHAEALAEAMDFRPLYKTERHLYSIGCNLVQGRLDSACYDLLASESSLTSFLTIARGEAPRRHWFQLGRPYLRAARRIGLVSWGGTMFEYLMPRLVMRSLPGTLVAEAGRTAVDRQIEYGRQAGIPWGISESAFASRYVDGDYQYQSFGVPGLGLKRGLDRDLVVAPYATALASMLVPREALTNFRRLAEEGAEGPFGFYEAVDFTPERVSKGRRSTVVRSYMAHHQGMSLVALTNTLLDETMPRRFHADPMVRAVDLLLQERMPRDAPLVEPSGGPASAAAGTERQAQPLLSRRLTTANTPAPRTHLLSNSRYHVMVTNSGAGYSTCRGSDVTRWREDSTRDAHGQFLYVHDLDRGLLWSAGHQPVCRPADDYEVVFAADKATLRRLDGGIETLVEITVSPEQLAEVRKLTLTNRDDRPRVLEVTSYAEVVLGPRGGDLAHPAFGKLFLETEWLPGSEALLCRRRPRAHDEQAIWAVHVAAAEAETIGAVQYETDRDRFVGRGRTPAAPRALEPGAALSGTTGPVLDPIFSLRRRVRIEPGGSATVAFTTAVADTREEALSLADQYHEPSAVARAFELAWAHSQIEHRSRNWSPEDAPLFQRLASPLIYAGSSLRAASAVLAANHQGQPALWRLGISGDLPIILLRIGAASEVDLARQVITAHSYLRHKGLPADLVLLIQPPAELPAELHQKLIDTVRASDAHDLVDRPGGLYLRNAAAMSEADLILVQAASRVVLLGDRGPLASQLDRIERLLAPPRMLATAGTRWLAPPPDDEGPAEDLLFDNGLGGFTRDGLEYRMTIRGAARADVRRNGVHDHPPLPQLGLPPAPWINVVANPVAGFLVSEAGSGYTWAGNSQGNRLTPWSNDPVSDPPGEVVYLRDESTGEVWTPTPLPVPASAPTVVRHGQGYTIFERRTHGLAHELVLFAAADDPVKLIRLKVRNLGDQPRSLSATFFAEWVLGTTRDAAASHVVTELDVETGALLARNPFRTDFADRVAFVDVDVRPRTVTADRLEFLGRNGSAAAPAGLKQVELSGRVGAALDPCAAVQTKFALGPGEETSVIFLLGEAATDEAVRGLVERYREPGEADAALVAVRARWDALLGAVQIRTPDGAIDLLLNRWLLYQVVSCRLWGRSAFYQSGGAYGFRDQLQDVMALVHGAPDEARAHILRAAARQFVEGDVQHWWHPPLGRGVRTRFSDDLLWLPLVVCHYVETTGDAGILDEVVPFLDGPVLKPGQDEDYGLPAVSSETGTLYEHCLRALRKGTQLGAHGLPLMGTGDWNDGMNRVGAGGRGESVWDAWFLVTILHRFAPMADARGDSGQAASCRDQAEALRLAIESEAWDGQWYRRAYFDDGTPLGSIENDECQIDSIAQTWAVISGAARPERARTAMAEVEARLVRRDEGLILLFTPPFDCGTLEPGYIKGYVPGIRENGGQYTHAATWVVLAAALQGQGRRAVELFNLLNPIHHAGDPQSVARYKVEPYVVAADVYGRPPHTGRGGWTWYTGSAAWLYRVALESILGFRRRGDRLVVDPCIPGSWPRFEIVYRHGSACYRIAVENPRGIERGISAVSLDGRILEDSSIPLVDDGQHHEVLVVLGDPADAAGV